MYWFCVHELNTECQTLVQNEYICECMDNGRATYNIFSIQHSKSFSNWFNRKKSFLLRIFPNDVDYHYEQIFSTWMIRTLFGQFANCGEIIVKCCALCMTTIKNEDVQCSCAKNKKLTKKTFEKNNIKLVFSSFSSRVKKHKAPKQSIKR